MPTKALEQPATTHRGEVKPENRLNVVNLSSPEAAARPGCRTAGFSEPCRDCFARAHCHIARLMLMADQHAAPVTDRQAAGRGLYTRVLSKNEHICREGDRHEAIYAVKSGLVKSWMTSADGPEPVLAFHLPGETFGFDAVATGIQNSSATAIENSVVCVLPVTQLEAIISRTPGAFRWLLGLAGNIISGYQASFAMLSRTKAESRLGQFLLDLSRRYRQRGYAPDQFDLSMSRQDVSKFLGIAQETLSRLMSRLDESGIVKAERRRITILDRDRLEALARHSGAMAGEFGSNARQVSRSTASAEVSPRGDAEAAKQQPALRVGHRFERHDRITGLEAPLLRAGMRGSGSGSD